MPEPFLLSGTELILIAEVPKAGDRWNQVHLNEVVIRRFFRLREDRRVTLEGVTREGRIFMLGVAPDCRGQGIGRRLLLAGLAHLKSKGLPVAVLTVDSDNESACALYRALGFQLRTSSLWYEKEIAQDTEAS